MLKFVIFAPEGQNNVPIKTVPNFLAPQSFFLPFCQQSLGVLSKFFTDLYTVKFDI